MLVVLLPEVARESVLVLVDSLFLRHGDERLLLTVEGNLFVDVHDPLFFLLLEESSVLIGRVAELRKVSTPVLQLHISPLLYWSVKIRLYLGPRYITNIARQEMTRQISQRLKISNPK